MTDKARELLERALDYVHKRSLDEEILRDEIRRFIAEPEVKRKALSHQEITKNFNEIYPELDDEDEVIRTMNWGCFHFGVRFAEKHHGIAKDVREETPD